MARIVVYMHRIHGMAVVLLLWWNRLGNFIFYRLAATRVGGRPSIRTSVGWWDSNLVATLVLARSLLFRSWIKIRPGQGIGCKRRGQ